LKNEKNIKRHQKTKPCRERATSIDDTSVLKSSWNCRGTDWEGLVGTRFRDIKANLSKASEAFMSALKPTESEDEAAETESPPHEAPKVTAPEPTVTETVTVAPTKPTKKLVHQKAPVTPATEILVHQKQTGVPVPEARVTKIAKPRKWKGYLPQALAWVAEQLDISPADLPTLGQRQYNKTTPSARGLWFALGDRRGAVTATIERLMPQVVAYYNDAMGMIETRCDGGQPTVTMRCDGCKKTVHLTQADADRYLPTHNRRCPRCDRGTFRVVEATA
jgi:phage FluMu protein Com